MKKHELIILLVMICIISSFCDLVFGFGNEATHPAMTSKSISMSALDDYLKNNLALSDGVQTELQYDTDLYNSLIKNRIAAGNCEPERTKRTVFNWIRAGSDIEDIDENPKPPLPSIRARHHFHDPIRNSGLDNKYDHPNYSRFINILFFDVTGQSALTWAINGEAQQKPYDNFECWERARYDFHRAITEPAKSRREEFLAMLFLEFGSVLHMIEDMGVPAHARNDFLFSHLTYDAPATFGNDFENWVERIVTSNGNQCPWSGSSPVVFDKLVKYFDADIYSGGYLGDGGLPPNTWGLSECSNYQFLSLSTMFGCSEVKYQFPNPAKEHLGPALVVPVPDGKKVYFNGSNYGVSHLARQSYTYYFADEHGVYDEEIDSTNTTDDTGVFEDYANITVPRTINYATGLINYFFRGRLNVEKTGCVGGKIEITVTNKSTNSDVNQILKGGTFTLYWDDSSGNRTPVSDFTVYRPGTEPQPGNEWDSTTQMNYDESTKAVLTPPGSQDVNQYILVYEGIISANPNSPDTDDTHQIAVGFRYLCKSCCSPYHSNVYLLSALSPTGRDISLSDSCRGYLCQSSDVWSSVPDFHDAVDVAVNPKKEVLVTYKNSQGRIKWAKIDGCNVYETGDFPIQPTYYTRVRWDMCTSDFIVQVSPIRFYKMSYNGNVVWDTGDIIYPGHTYYQPTLSISPRYIESSFVVYDNGYKFVSIIISQYGSYSYSVVDGVGERPRAIDSLGNLWSYVAIGGHNYLRKNGNNFKELDGSCFGILPSPSADIIYILEATGSNQWYYIGAIYSTAGEYKWRKAYWQMRFSGEMRYVLGEDIILIKQMRQASDWGSLKAFNAIDGSVLCTLGEVLYDQYTMTVPGVYHGCGSLENIHVADCQAQPQECPLGKKGQVDFRIVDSLGHPIAGALVDFSYDGIISGDGNAISNENGHVLGYTDCTDLHGEIIFYLKNVVKYKYVYKPEGNVCNQASCIF